MKQNMDKILSFELSGKFAHFRKYYTNTSALSYLIPSKTVLMGMISSILKIPRNEYYNLFASENEESISISVKISEGCEILKKIHSLNNISKKYWDLANFNIKGVPIHSPTKTEILVSKDYSNIKYKVFIGYRTNNKLIMDLIAKISKRDFGFGIYLGQRQFIGNIDKLNLYQNNQIQFLEETNYLSTISTQDNFVNCDFSNTSFNIIKERMPIGFTTFTEKKTGVILRKPCAPENIMFEKMGKVIEGQFKNCYKISLDNQKEEYVSFF